jgi:cephalosporin hydroxylase
LIVDLDKKRSIGETAMPTHDEHVKALGKKITELSDALAHLGKGTDLAELIKIIRYPGYTTPAEWGLHMVILDSMQTQVKVLAKLSSELLSAGKLIAKNNQVA